HLHESEAARTPGLAVHHDAHARHRTVVLKQRAQFVLGSSKRQVTYKNTLQTISPWLPVRPAPPLAYTKLLMGAGPRSAAPSDPLMPDRAGRPTCPSPAELCLARGPEWLRHSPPPARSELSPREARNPPKGGTIPDPIYAPLPRLPPGCAGPFGPGDSGR